MRGFDRLLVSVFALLLIIGPAWIGSASAQDATPSSSGRPPAAGAAELGTAVTYIDQEGVEHGEVAVTEIFDPFTDYDEGYEPAEGTRYVVLHVSFEATGEASFDADPNDLLLRDSDGYLWSPASVNRGSEPAMPDAQSQTMAVGNKISGAVGFNVPEDAEISEIYYQPESGHLILLADLAGADRVPAAIGDEVTYVDAEGAERGIVSVMEVTDPFTDYPEGYEPTEGGRYVVIAVSFEATGSGSFEADPYDFLLRDENGFLWAPASVNRGPEPAMPDAQSQTLAPGNKISGAIGFVVPADSAIEQVFYQPESGHLILLAELSEE
jgi:hypothetical protein